MCACNSNRRKNITTTLTKHGLLQNLLLWILSYHTVQCQTSRSQLALLNYGLIVDEEGKLIIHWRNLKQRQVVSRWPIFVSIFCHLWDCIQVSIRILAWHRRQKHSRCPSVLSVASNTAHCQPHPGSFFDWHQHGVDPATSCHPKQWKCLEWHPEGDQISCKQNMHWIFIYMYLYSKGRRAKWWMYKIRMLLKVESYWPYRTNWADACESYLWDLSKVCFGECFLPQKNCITHELPVSESDSRLSRSLSCSKYWQPEHQKNEP